MEPTCRLSSRHSASGTSFQNMDGDCGSWPHLDGQPPDFTLPGAWTRHYLGLQDQLSTSMYPWHAPIATNQGFTVPSLANHLNTYQTHFDHTEPHGWFYCLPTFSQEMYPPSNSVLNEHLSVESSAATKKDDSHNAGQQFYQKQFLVFDQTGDQTTMIYSSGVGAPPAHCHSIWKEKKAAESIFRSQQDGINMVGSADTFLMNNFIDISEFDVDNESDLQSEMHEDTEELDALMYSDDDTDVDDEDEVTSTGHSPSTLAIQDKQNVMAGIGEEVASSDEEPIKRQKLFNAWNVIAKNDYHVTLSHSTIIVADDTESRCGSPVMCDSGRHISLPCKKRDRKDSIRETVRTLQSMIHCGKGATPVEVIDEAINFLLSLKLKANSLGSESTK